MQSLKPLLRIVVVLTVFTQYTSSQFEFVGSVPSNMRGSFHETPLGSVVKTNNSLFYLSRIYRNELYAIKETSNRPVLIKSYKPRRIYRNMYEHNDNLFFITTNSSGSGEIKIHKCNNNYEISELAQHDSGISFNITKAINDIIYYTVKENNLFRFYKFNLSNEQLDTLYESSKEIKLIEASNEGLIFIEKVTSQQTKLVFLDNNGTDQVLSTGYFIASFSSWNNNLQVKTSDSLNWYVKLLNDDGTFDVFRVKKDNLEIKSISSLNILEIHPKIANHYFTLLEGNYNPYYLSQIDSDTLELLFQFNLKSDLTPSNYSFYLESAKKGIYSIHDINYGLELGALDVDDSIKRIQDLNQGKFSAIPFRSCSVGGHPSYSTKFFEHNNHSYAFLSNGNDEYVYLYEVFNDTLISLSKAPEFNVSRARIIAFDDYIYYITLNTVSNENQIYRWKWDSSLDQQPSQEEFNNLTWYSELGFNREDRPCPGNANNMRSQNVIYDDSGNLFISFINNQYGGLHPKSLVYDLKNKTYVPNSLSDVYAKYDAYGELKWLRGIGSKYKFFDSYDQFTINQDGEANIFGVFHSNGYFDTDTIQVTGSHRYWAKLDSETGDVLEVKPLYQTTFVDDPEFFRVKADIDGNFYISGKYNNFELDLNDTLLVSDWEHQSFLAKYDSNGNVIWARNVLTNWTDFIGNIRNIELNQQKKEILVFSSQNRTFSCNNDNWGGVMIIYDFDGKEKRRLVLTGKNQHHNGISSQLNNDKVMIKGVVSGTISTDIYEYSTPIGDDCYELSEYTIIYDKKQNRVVSARVTTDNNGIIPIAVRQDGNYKYFMGKDFNTNKVVFQRYDLEGNYLGMKTINQIANRVNFDVQNNLFTLIGPNFSSDKELKVVDTWRYSDVNSVLKFQINNWNQNPIEDTPMNIKFIEEDLGLNIYPNPFNSFFEVNFQDIENEFEYYQITNSLGQIIQEGKVLKQNFMRFDLSHEKQGLYFLSLFGENERKTVKVIKL